LVVKNHPIKGLEDGDTAKHSRAPPAGYGYILTGEGLDVRGERKAVTVERDQRKGYFRERGGIDEL
jgi:hypothetical protein